MNTLAEPLAEPLAEHRRAVLTADQPQAELITGDVGVVVFIHGEGAAYEVEFPNRRRPHPRGRPSAGPRHGRNSPRAPSTTLSQRMNMDLERLAVVVRMLKKNPQ